MILVDNPSPPAPEPLIVGPDGKPIVLPSEAACPNCGADADQRVPSCGFGVPHLVCQVCAYEFSE